MRKNSQDWMWGAILCVGAGALWAWEKRQAQIAALTEQIVNARQELQRTIRRAQQVEAESTRLASQVQESAGERRQFQARAEEAQREVQLLRQRAAAAEGELTRLMQLASAQGVTLKTTVA